MAVSEFHDAALVLVAHGSTLNPGSAQPAWQHAEALRRRGLFAEVAAMFWQLEPFVGGLRRHVHAPRIFVVPLFIADGWFTEHVIPRELGLRGPESAATDFTRVQVRDGRTLHYCRAVGSHPSMTDVLLARARGVVARHPFPGVPAPRDTALCIVGHGTGYSRGSRAAIERQVEALRSLGTYAEVHGVFLEESPRVDEVFQLTRARNLVVLPFFISDGLHTLEDIPELLGEPAPRIRQRLNQGRPTWPNPTERQGRRIWCAPAVGTEPLLADVVLERVRESAAVPSPVR